MVWITDGMTSGAAGADVSSLVGRTIVAAHEVEGSDRSEALLLLDGGTSILLSCDPGYVDEDCTIRDPRRWEVVLYDATDTPAGRAARAAVPS